MRLETKYGLFPPQDRSIEEIESDGYIIILVTEDGDVAEWVEDDQLSMSVAETVIKKTELQLQILSWD